MVLILINEKAFYILRVIVCSCGRNHAVDNKHIESLADNFMKSKVMPAMPSPKPFAIVSEKVISKTVADNIDDYRFVYDHLSFNKNDSMINKARLDSVMKASDNPDSVINITVNVAYKIKYKRGNIVTDSIKLGYDVRNDKITYWPF